MKIMPLHDPRVGMRSLVVVGAQWGDEGKGKIVHLLSNRADLIVRFQGGNNAGHTVVCGGKKYALHLAPSGILIRGKKVLIGNGVVVNPSALRDEVRKLAGWGVKARGRLFVSPSAHIILPYHIFIDTLREEGGRGIGTTKRGIGPCYEDKVARIGIRVSDYLEPEVFRTLVERNLRVRSAELMKVKPLKAIREDVYRDYAKLRSFLAPFVGDTAGMIVKALGSGRKVLFEGAQGVMLDLDFGTYPFVTSSNTLAGNASVGSGVGPACIGEVLGVTKAYTTRVGQGPFPSEIFAKTAHYIREKGAEYGTTTGRPRRIGWLDLVQLKWAAQASGISQFAVTKLDTLANVHPLRVCTAYKLGRRRLDAYPHSRSQIFDAEPVYESLPGFSGDLSRVRRFEDLPKAARDYVLFIEQRLGVPVRIVSVGQSREQTIFRGEPCL